MRTCARLSAVCCCSDRRGSILHAALGALDSSLKRNTAFIKRLRTSLQAADSVAALIKEVNVLNLGKYTSELVAATLEGLARCKTGTEIAGAVEVGPSNAFQQLPPAARHNADE